MDAATLEIVRNYFSAIGTAMSRVIERTSYSTYISESADFATALSTPDGDFFAYPASAGVTNFLGLTLTKAIESAGGNESMKEGDILITNDPYTTDGLSTHLPDVHIFKPVFYNGELICYAWCFVHTADIGGSVPSSLTPAATDIQMEGLRIPPVRLYTEGKLNNDIRSIYLSASRMPTMMLGDLNGMISAVNTAEKRMIEVVEKFGVDVVKEASKELLLLTEKRTRKIFDKIPDGEYEFSDYLDDDVETTVPLRVSVIVKVEGSDITLDFSKCDPQVRTAFNLITGGSKHSYLYQGLLSHIISEDPYIPFNGGLTFPIHVIAPEGTLVNAQYPCAGGLRHPISLRLYSAVQGALAKVIPDHLQAAGGGQVAVTTLSLPDLKRGGAYSANVIEPLGGGGGAQYKFDGVNGIDAAVSFIRNTPIESLEQRTDILIHKYKFIENTGGAGKYRGGASICLEFEPLREGAIVGARGQERMSFEPWGLNGGKAGKLGHVVLNPGTDSEQELSKLKMLPVEKNDVISFRTPSGGGWGNPLERDVELVLKDVKEELVDIEHAKSDYGVVIINENGELSVDNAETDKLRESLLNNSAPSDTTNSTNIDLGPSREKYESVWSKEASDTLALLLQKLPSSVRSTYKHKAHSYFDGHAGAISALEIEKWFSTVQ